ncbi:MAG: organoarsenical effux MFS transporter ArsJ [Pseudomonadota bacterium]
MLKKMTDLSTEIKQYLVVTANYWAFTLTDGALRMLVVLHFHQLGYGPLRIAALFLFYELFGVVTNLLGGYLGARIGLNRTMNIGLALQVLALLMLAAPSAMLTMYWVVGAQALSGIAKDLNKLSAKSAIKMLVPGDKQQQLFKWVALLTGSKNALKGVGFFLGGALLVVCGFQGSVIIMAAVLGMVWLASLILLKKDLGKTKNKPKFSEIFSKSYAVNILSAARLFLFAARDVWFVVALPVYLSSQLGWSFWWVGSFFAGWIIGYGILQSLAPTIIKNINVIVDGEAKRFMLDGHVALCWAILLAVVTAGLALALQNDLPAASVLIVGLTLFAAVFAINSSLHSFLIVSYAKSDGASLDIGFYYTANAMGRLVGTLLSGWIYQSLGLVACLWTSALFIVVAALITTSLPRKILPDH